MIAITLTSYSNIQIVNNYQLSLKKEHSNASEILYLIIIHFDYSKEGRRKQFVLECLNRYKNLPGIRIVLVEAAIDDLFDLPDKLEGVFIHHKFKIKHFLQIKENLVNVAISKLPNDWQYVSWIDTDLTFLNPNWVEETISELKRSDFIQLYQTAVFMGPNGEALDIFKSVGFVHQISTKKVKYDTAWVGQPGYACAMTKWAYEKMNGLFDEEILGGSDTVTSYSIIQKVDIFYKKWILKQSLTYQLKALANKIKFSYINGTILHSWHGSFADRGYGTRYKIFIKHGYNHKIDITRDKNGIIQLTKIGERMHADLKAFFCPKCS